eukprot:m.359353 g.359353  ORF g.359353 m.359353 type:complete len:750 (+) comp55993_c1_seq5:3-2252(+)
MNGAGEHSVLQAAVSHALKLHAYEDAVFLAERLYFQEGSEGNSELLAECYFQSGQYQRAYSTLRPCTHPAARYLFARCCVRLNKLQEAEMALTGALYPTADVQMSDLAFTNGQVYTLMGDICRKSNRFAQATEWYQKAVAENPFNWSAFQALCHAGVEVSVDSVFQATPKVFDMVKDWKHTQLFAPALAGEGDRPLPYSDPSLLSIDSTVDTTGNHTMQTPKLANSSVLYGIGSVGGGIGIMSSLGTPPPSSFVTPPLHASIVAPRRAPPLPLPVKKAPAPQLQPPQAAVHLSHISDTTTATTPESVVPARRSERRFPGSSNTSAFSQLRAPSSRVVREVKEPAKDIREGKEVKKTAKKAALFEESTPIMSRASKPPIPFETTERTHEPLLPLSWLTMHDLEEALSLLRALGSAYLALCLYQCQEAISLFNALPTTQLQSGWAQCNLAKAHLELADYPSADAAYRMSRRVEPYRIEGCAYFSTVLWYLQQDVPLSYLANEVVNMDRESSEAWCVVGNCFSLQNDHDAAIKFFQRAIQLDNEHAYAHTLLGHEHIYHEDFTQGIACFRNALRHDPRHYNAWYGLGMVYYKQEKFEQAELHFRKAYKINGSNPLLLCYLGMVLHAQRKHDQALKAFDKALELNGNVPVIVFNKAILLLSTEKYDAALELALKVKEMVPVESAVYFLLSKIYQKKGQDDQARIQLLWALNLDPKGSQRLFKEAAQQHHLMEDEDIDRSSTLSTRDNSQGEEA